VLNHLKRARTSQQINGREATSALAGSARSTVGEEATEWLQDTIQVV
jgi:hypothetical protein